MIAGLLLASGASRRFGADKLLQPLGDRTVIRWCAEAIAPAVDALYVVVPREALALRAALDGLAVRWVVNPAPDTGMSGSIRAGVAALPPETDAVLVALGDQPFIETDVARRIVARWREGGTRAVAPAYEDGRGHPVLFGAALLPTLLSLDGDRGARALLDTMGPGLASVAVRTPQPIDVDTPDALRQAVMRLAHSGERGR